MAFRPITDRDRALVDALVFWRRVHDHAEVVREGALARLEIAEEAFGSLDRDRWFGNQDELLQLGYLSKLHGDFSREYELLAEARVSLSAASARTADLLGRLGVPRSAGGG